MRHSYELTSKDGIAYLGVEGYVPHDINGNSEAIFIVEITLDKGGTQRIELPWWKAAEILHDLLRRFPV